MARVARAGLQLSGRSGDYLKYQMGRHFYHSMGALPDVMLTGKAPSYVDWFSDPVVAETYTQAQHNGSIQPLSI